MFSNHLWQAQQEWHKEQHANTGPRKHSNFHQPNTQQYVSSDKHRQMIRDAAQRRLADCAEQSQRREDNTIVSLPLLRLRKIAVALTNLVTR